MPISHHTYQQSYPLAIIATCYHALPFSHHAYHPSEFQDFKTALQAFQYYIFATFRLFSLLLVIRMPCLSIHLYTAMKGPQAI